MFATARIGLRGGSRGRVQGVRTRPPGMTCGRFLINTVQSLDRHTKSALSFDMYSQQFTLCYFPVKSPLLRIRSQNFLRHRSVSGAPPPEKNPGSPPGACPCEYFPRNCGSSTRYPGSTSLLQQKIIYWTNKEVDSWQGIESCTRSCLSDALALPASWSSRPELLKNITSAYVTSGFWKIFTYFYFEMSLLTATELILGENDLHRGSMRRRCHSPKRLEGQEAFEETHFKYR